MLVLKPNCECCDTDLPPDAEHARICSFECTFCADCVAQRLGGVCPNCGGNFVPRPVRPADKLHRFPASTNRFTKAHAACPPLHDATQGA
ncbi:DUF1272 domain-containing protein [Tateyamaria sp. SN3-11]|uniref:DUF1272 domain-containing protein n=1 Tax=Tateyamaria sp. SN3-11 TaxID=3092147 RepID=UPI0039EA7A31